ncbi:MAG: pyridoxamine 5'-phosphate oxidase family protein [Longimicrobiaceae bacterium]
MHIRSLDREEIEEILARNHVGRLAYAKGNRVDIEPLHYVYDVGWIYGRTSPGTKIETTGTEWWPVAFEVDEVKGIFEWRSVVVHGGFYTIPREGWTTAQRETWMRGVGLLRRLIPETFRDDDPAPHRTLLFRIAVQEASGREATPADGDE